MKQTTKTQSDRSMYMYMYVSIYVCWDPCPNWHRSPCSRAQNPRCWRHHLEKMSTYETHIVVWFILSHALYMCVLHRALIHIDLIKRTDSSSRSDRPPLRFLCEPPGQLVLRLKADLQGRSLSIQQEDLKAHRRLSLMHKMTTCISQNDKMHKMTNIYIYITIELKETFWWNLNA